jgi:S-formylglutathione hydrolase FrmB
MGRLHWLLACGLLAVGTAATATPGLRPCTWYRLQHLNDRLRGAVLDFTHNHGADRRVYSPALGERRDLYVYLPPCFDPRRSYPVMIFLHGVAQDEQFFLRVVEDLDRAMACGKLPPLIIAAPDGSLTGTPSVFLRPGSFFLNSKAGRFEDYIVCDVWQFLTENFPIRPERELHILAGGSMGGFGAYNLGFKHPDRFKVLAGVMPPLNLRYTDCHGRYFANFDPACTGLREQLRPFQPVAKYFGLITIRERRLALPLYGVDREAIQKIAADNPIEMLDTYNVRPGEFDMFIGYAGRDEFNIDAQVESFLYAARQRGLTVAVAYDPRGHHTPATGFRLFPDFVRWLGPLLAGYEQAGTPPSAG